MYNYIMYCVYLSYIQSIPDINNAPSLLCPSPEKIDLDRLLREIPKYQPWVSPTAFEQWKKFADEARQLFTAVNPDVVWTLPILQVAAASRPVASNNAPEISETTRALLDKDFRTPKAVCTGLYSLCVCVCVHGGVVCVCAYVRACVNVCVY